jgi:hypothetical protein
MQVRAHVKNQKIGKGINPFPILFDYLLFGHAHHHGIWDPLAEAV